MMPYCPLIYKKFNSREQGIMFIAINKTCPRHGSIVNPHRYVSQLRELSIG